MNQPPSDDDLKDMFPTLDPPPGGLLRLRARRGASRARPWPWLLAGAAVAAAAAVALLLRPAPPGLAPFEPAPSHAAPDLIAGRDLSALHPAWIGLGRVPAPSEPLLLGSELAAVFASRRVPVADRRVVFYMLDPRGPVPDTPE